MSDKFTVEIITPDNSIFKSEANEVTIPSYEGQMGILKDHISLITFLRPGLILIKGIEEKKYYVEEGIVEFSNNKLLILTSTIEDIINFSKDSIEDLLNVAENKLRNDNFTDKEKYLLSHKISTLKEINQ
ncbi:ATP synthase F1 subunit epsilon [Pelagibacteraceae bacterium]|jgi:F-type H+-transporting ATPase subunit epsilon|nr:ATP synthase F1 subunit epsilon [Pelagibacteraceae bacterium]MDC1159007.1 ATP synthase F1 subunit epsilon [Pelagibacteraceae bacterium]